MLMLCGWLWALQREVPGTNTPAVVAHRGGSGAAPQNSLAAVSWAAERGLGVELDVVLSADGVPMLSHDPWLVRETCGRVETPTSPLDEVVLVHEQTAAALQRDFRCGGIEDPTYEGEPATAGGASVPRLAEALALLPERAELFLDLKILDGVTAGAERFAEAIVPLIAGRAGRVWLEVPRDAHVRALREAGIRGPQRKVLMSWPAFTPSVQDTSATWSRLGLRTLLATDLRLINPIAKAREAGADGIVSLRPVLSPSTAERVRDAGLAVVWFVGADTMQGQKDAVAALCAGPGDLLILDYADRLFCEG